MWLADSQEWLWIVLRSYSERPKPTSQPTRQSSTSNANEVDETYNKTWKRWQQANVICLLHLKNHFQSPGEKQQNLELGLQVR